METISTETRKMSSDLRGQYERWMEENERSRGTIRKYGYYLALFQEYLGGREITRREVIRWKEVLKGRFSPGTVNGAPARMRQVVRVPMEDSVYMVVEEMPKFPEGDVTRWIAEHMEYSPVGCGVSGKVFVKFVVEKDGRITNAQVLRPEDPVLDKEAIRLVESMPRWIPGKQDGKPVRVSYVVPVNFQLQ